MKKLLKKILYSKFIPTGLKNKIIYFHQYFKAYSKIKKDKIKIINNKSSYQNDMLKFKFMPLISILVPIHNSSEKHLNKTIKSILNQFYPNYEAIFIADKSTNQKLINLINHFIKKDSRIKLFHFLKLDDISSKLNFGISNSSGIYISYLKIGDFFREDALFLISSFLQNKNNLPDLIYTDDVVLNSFSIIFNYKPDFNHEKLISHNYIGYYLTFSRDLIKRCGEYSNLNGDAKDYEFILRASKHSKNIIHVPEPIHFRYSENKALSQAEILKNFEDSKNALIENIKSKESFEFEIFKGNLPNSFHIKRKIKNNPLVSIFIPFKDKAKLTLNCIQSIYEYNDYNNFEIILVNNHSEEVYTKQVIKYIEEKYKNIRILENNKLFNYSLLNNFASNYAKGDYFLLLNNDILAFRPGWLYELIQHIQRPNVGAVGPMLIYEDGTIQHAGVVMGLGGIAGHVGRNLPYNSSAWNGRLILEHNVSCVTGAALMTKRDVWKKIGGMDESFPIDFNDVDFCLQIRKAGYDIIYNPYSVLIHYESKSRGEDISSPENHSRFSADNRKFLKKWGHEITYNDPFYSKHLTRISFGMTEKAQNEDELYNQILENHTDPFKNYLTHSPIRASE